MLTPILTILGKLANPRVKAKVKARRATSDLESPALAGDGEAAAAHDIAPDKGPDTPLRRPHGETPPRVAAPTPLSDDLAQVWRGVQIDNAMQAKPRNFSQLVSLLKRDAQHPLYPVGIHTLRRHMLVIDPARLKARPIAAERENHVTDAPAAASIAEEVTLEAPRPRDERHRAPRAAAVIEAAAELDVHAAAGAHVDALDDADREVTPEDRDIDELHFLSDYRRPAPAPLERFGSLADRQPQRFNKLDELSFL